MSEGGRGGGEEEGREGGRGEEEQESYCFVLLTYIGIINVRTNLCSTSDLFVS